MAATETLDTRLHTWARETPRQTFLVSPETRRTLSYGELHDFRQRLAAHYDAHGIAAGDAVAMLLGNGLAAAALFIGTMASARVIVPLNLLSQGAQLAYTIEHCDCRLVWTSAEHEARVREAVRGIDRAIEVCVIDPDSTDWLARASASSDTQAGADDIALLMYTSGTTGRPKGALLSHANLLHAAGNVARWHSLTPADRVLSALPLYHINGQVIATLTPFVSGGSIVAPRRFSVSTWWALATEHRCTWLNMVPTIIAYLLNAAADDPAGTASIRRRITGIRFGRSASAPLPAEHHRAFEALFGLPVIEAMGMTESASVVFCNPMPPARSRIGSPGLPLGVQARVVDAQGHELPDGQQGEILLRGANVMRGYYKAPEQSRDAFDGTDWLRTGDLGHRDADGFYFITGRLKELIIKGGENIAPREIDEALLRHPAVLEAAAVGIADPNYGQEILACVVLRDGMRCSADELRGFCERELGRYKTPREFRFVAELPKGPSGKVQRLRLSEAG
ncbi:MAG: AMP-binding protein [Burkholderiales bacterium]|nr:AMP-binding protein [Burkholderiales bacterium]